MSGEKWTEPLQALAENHATGMPQIAEVEHRNRLRDHGFDLIEVVSEYRALRASVLQLWRDSGPEPDELEPDRPEPDEPDERQWRGVEHCSLHDADRRA